VKSSGKREVKRSKPAPAVASDRDELEPSEASGAAPSEQPAASLSESSEASLSEPAEAEPREQVGAQLDVLHAALDALRAEGGGAFDEVSCACVLGLIARARQLEPRAAELLGLRAGAHLARLRERFAAERERTALRLEQAEQRVGTLPREREALKRGALGAVRRALRRLGAGPQPQAAVAIVRDERKRRTGEYRSALADYISARAVARAVDGVPEQAGPYNPLRIASDLLVRISTFSPIYLSSQLQRLEELASLMNLPELPAPPPPPPTTKAQPGKKTRRALPQKGGS
jgi:hypothetical protein